MFKIIQQAKLHEAVDISTKAKFHDPEGQLEEALA